MKGLQTLSILNNLYEEMQEPPSTTFTYAMLAEMSRLVEMLGKDEPTRELMKAYLYIADEYMSLRHFTLARDYYLKALEVLQHCDKNIFEDKDALKMFEDCCVSLLHIYGMMGAEDAMDSIYKLIRDVMPERLDEIHQKSMKKSDILNDTVEYTEKYLNILIELETKIEEELKGVPQGMSFCFEYWRTKEKILKEDYGIDWDSPAVLNPDTRFD